MTSNEALGFLVSFTIEDLPNRYQQFDDSQSSKTLNLIFLQKFFTFFQKIQICFDVVVWRCQVESKIGNFNFCLGTKFEISGTKFIKKERVIVDVKFSLDMFIGSSNLKFSFHKNLKIFERL